MRGLLCGFLLFVLLLPTVQAEESLEDSFIDSPSEFAPSMEQKEMNVEYVNLGGFNGYNMLGSGVFWKFKYNEEFLWLQRAAFEWGFHGDFLFNGKTYGLDLSPTVRVYFDSPYSDMGAVFSAGCLFAGLMPSGTLMSTSSPDTQNLYIHPFVGFDVYLHLKKDWFFHLGLEAPFGISAYTMRLGWAKRF